MEALLRHVRGREMLVILDNCEHLLASCASLVTHLLQKAPRLRILATSRESLRILGEATFPVPRLGLAADGSSEAVQLFVERAKAASPAFEITPANGTTVSELCRRLDGIPLALELAAARLRALSVEAIAERLGERFGLLKVPIATATPRHQALRACLDWSHDLLPEQERVVLRRLAVFAGGCRLDAAEAVVAGGTVAADDVAELLANLVDKSMVEHDPATDRYGLLETVRQYALERLAESGDEQATRGRHLHYHVQLVETAWPHLDGSNPRPWFARLDIERENLLAAHGFCDEAPDGAEQGLRLTIARRYWIQRAHVDLAMQMILRALGHRQVDRHPALRASATAVAGLYASFKADYAAARRHLEDCLSMEATAADPNIEAYARRVLGGVCHSCGERQAARRHFEACLALRARVRDQFIVYLCLNNLSYLHIEQGEFEAAERLLAESFAFFTEAAHPNHHALTLFGATTLCLHRGDAVNARRCLGAATRIIEWLDLLSLRPVALEIAAALAALEGDAERAARYIGASGAEVAQTHIFLYAPGSALRAPFIDAARKRLGAEAFAAAEAIGRELSYQEALSEASRWLSPERVPEEASS
jgi:predicted ATPase